MSEPIKWTNVTLKLSQLKKWENNPAEISKDAAGRLVECFNEFGQIETLAVDPENRLVDGHQRLDTWLAKYGDIEVDCRKASRLLTEKERQKIAVMLRSGAVGRYNWDVVSSWSADDLQGWGMDSGVLGDWKRDVTALEMMLISEGADVKDGFDFSSLPSEDRAPFRQVTFTLHDIQYEQMAEALKLSKGMGAFDSENENSNGNAIARICEVFITEHGNG